MSAPVRSKVIQVIDSAARMAFAAFLFFVDGKDFKIAFVLISLLSGSVVSINAVCVVTLKFTEKTLSYSRYKWIVFILSARTLTIFGLNIVVVETIRLKGGIKYILLCLLAESILSLFEKTVVDRLQNAKKRTKIKEDKTFIFTDIRHGKIKRDKRLKLRDFQFKQSGSEERLALNENPVLQPNSTNQANGIAPHPRDKPDFQGVKEAIQKFKNSSNDQDKDKAMIVCSTYLEEALKHIVPFEKNYLEKNTKVAELLKIIGLADNTDFENWAHKRIRELPWEEITQIFNFYRTEENVDSALDLIQSHGKKSKEALANAKYLYVALVMKDCKEGFKIETMLMDMLSSSPNESEQRSINGPTPRSKSLNEIKEQIPDKMEMIIKAISEIDFSNNPEDKVTAIKAMMEDNAEKRYKGVISVDESFIKPENLSEKLRQLFKILWEGEITDAESIIKLLANETEEDQIESLCRELRSQLTHLEEKLLFGHIFPMVWRLQEKTCLSEIELLIHFITLIKVNFRSKRTSDDAKILQGLIIVYYYEFGVDHPWQSKSEGCENCGEELY